MIPDYFSRPAAAQLRALLGLVALLRQRYAIPMDNVRGHRELAGCATRCPGGSFDLDAVRATAAEPVS